MTRKETLKNKIVMIGSGKSAPFYSLTEKSIKVDLVEATTNQYSNIFLEQYGYTTDNTIFAHVVDGAKGANVSAKLYTYNGNLFVLIGEVGSNTAFADTKVTLKILHI